MKMKVKLSWSIVAALIIPAGMALFSSCEKYGFEPETIDPGEPVLFQTQIQPVFTGNCIQCHKGSRDPDLRDGFSYASLTEGNYVSTPAENSKLYKQIVSGSHKAFTLDAEKQLVLIWIGQGALNN
jgi:mono/diheme cytochrome c family protein